MIIIVMVETATESNIFGENLPVIIWKGKKIFLC